MLPTPSTSHVNYNHIYEPAEDSYLILDTLSSPSETSFLQNRFPPSYPAPIILEVGTGSGVVLAFVTAHSTAILGRSDIGTLGVDVNALACEATKQTVSAATSEARRTRTTPASFLDPVVGDLTCAYKSGSIDVLIFNPPYVPSEELPALPVHQSYPFINIFERDSYLLSLSTDGGKDGMETTDRLFSQLDDVLTVRGVAYVLLCAQNKPVEITASIRSWPPRTYDHSVAEWNADIVGSSGKKAGWERLCVLRIWRHHHPV